MSNSRLIKRLKRHSSNLMGYAGATRRDIANGPGLKYVAWSVFAASVLLLAVGGQVALPLTETWKVVAVDSSVVYVSGEAFEVRGFLRGLDSTYTVEVIEAVIQDTLLNRQIYPYQLRLRKGKRQ